MRIRGKYTFRGQEICAYTFRLLFDIGRCALKSIRQSLNKTGPGPRRHGNTGRKPKHALVFTDVERVVQFICNYAEEFGIPQPAAPRGRDDTAPIYLHSGTTKINIHTLYKASCQEAGVRFVLKSSFQSIWSACIPHIKVASPRDDVCATCEKLRKKIMDAVSEEDKLASTGEMHCHIVLAQKERDLYNSLIKKAKETSHLCPAERSNHFTFDFAQSVGIPHHARQMGPLYFASLRKVHIFGMRIDGQSRQLNFLIDENESIGADGANAQGPNAVISMIDYVLNTHGCEDLSCTIHADNCPGELNFNCDHYNFILRLNHNITIILEYFYWLYLS